MGTCELFYWRERNREVDFVVRAGKRLLGVEVKSSRRHDALPGMTAFVQAHPAARPLLVGGDGIAVEEFLAQPVDRWLVG